ncbi:alginate lyase family protein [Candidatus Clostridium radicumherbarum]|uniref:Alginate lyase family protein n=1 Tax=Candidatus Clostridium radicumherbarum TaxID=3381662 RepID=A0ABW8TR80_9CLOT
MSNIKRLSKNLIKKIYFSLLESYEKFISGGLNSDYFMGFKTKCNFFFNLTQKNNYLNVLEKLKKVDDIKKDGGKICCHVFNLFASGDKYLSECIEWSKDFKTGFKWENKYYKNIKIVDLNNNSDVKVPWELSRFQHFFTIGKAYLLTSNKKYSLEFTKEIKDWIDKNPIKRSVNWTCTMEVAIRAVNWIAGYFFFKESMDIGKKFWNKFNKSLYLHGEFIFKNLENKGLVTGNHYLSNIVGLIWLGLYFKDFEDPNGKNAPKLWLDFGISEIEKEMLVQVNEDGTDYEASTAYHRLVTELFLLTTIFCNKNDIKFSDKYMSKLEKMCEFLMDITKSNGLAPLIGDVDDGRFIIISDYYTWVKRDFRHILYIAGEFFNREDFKFYGKKYKEDALWIIGPDSALKSVNPPVKLKSKAYKDGGYYILRNEKIYCLIRCGELSFRGLGVHSHNDQLSFELNVDGEDFIIDPGTFVYTADYKMRNLFRCTKMHNTISIEDCEQNYYEEQNLFYMKEQTNAKCMEFDDNKFVGRHYGFKAKCGIIHERTIVLKDDHIEITDKLISENKKVSTKDLNIIANFTLSEGVEIIKSKDSIELIKNKKIIKWNFSNNIMIKDSYLARSYGDLKDTKKLEVLINLN